MSHADRASGHRRCRQEGFQPRQADKAGECNDQRILDQGGGHHRDDGAPHAGFHLQPAGEIVSDDTAIIVRKAAVIRRVICAERDEQAVGHQPGVEPSRFR